MHGICRHMNDDHPEMALRIVRVLGGQPGAERVETVGVDELGMHFVAHQQQSTAPVAVPFARRAAERPQVRPAVIELYRRAAAQGSQPR